MTTLTFNEADAVDIGGMDDPLASLLGKPSRFHMTRKRTMNGAMRVDFCRIDDWCGVVVALGDWTTSAPQNLGPYTAVLEVDSASIEVDIAYHSWRSRWRWMNKPWPFPPTPLSELYAAKLLPRFDPQLTRGTDATYGPYIYEPLGLAGLCAYMPMTGGRADIGPVTGTQGWYLCHEGNAQALADVMAQGEAGASYPWDFYDPTTGTLIDPIIAYPSAGMFPSGYGANPAIPLAPYLPLINIALTGPPGTKLSAATPEGLAWNFVVAADGIQLRIPQDTVIPASGTTTIYVEKDSGGNTPPLEPLHVILWDGTPTVGVSATAGQGSIQYGSLLSIDTAHMPAVAYVPYLLTGDPYFLETLQMQAVFCVIENNSAVVRTGAQRQPRSSGWSARTLAQVARVSPDVVPSWLQPRSLWQTAIDQWEPKWRADTTESTDSARQAVHLIAYDTNNVDYQQWQEDIALSGLSWMALLHPTSAWVEDMRWLVQQSMARLTDGSGWPPTVPTTYASRQREAIGSPLYDNWQLMWDKTMPTLGMTEPPSTLWLHDPDYLGQMAEAMALAWQAGATECTTALTLLETMLRPPLEQQQITRSSSYAIAGPTSTLTFTVETPPTTVQSTPRRRGIV